MTAKMEKLEEIIEYIRAHPEEEKVYKSRVIEAHLPFIVHTITQVTGRYVEVENSEELSVGLIAFDEAMSKYYADRGATFLSFARLVISSRIKDFINKERRTNKVISLEQMTESNGYQAGMNDSNFENEVAVEVEIWESFIQKFGFDLEQLVDELPRHADTRNNAIDLSEKISHDSEIVDRMYQKYKLPMAKIILRFRTTKKVLKRSKKFIIATVVIFTKNLATLKQWIYSDRKRCSS
ncbi:sigma factor [Tepidibacter hydrothermalis]|uniref:RNA polymerase sigma factor SigI n=1 Tax=Tepidibacter hydrothermalis TaxID=3036126 RepID=A0ABY8E8E4_9FIRM|nr:sigma factor [Tepidibacter hydrothermalis]WFD09170.1 sigma factor [Tepidibacter hydrothermalis]